jgi:hypothetical protein
MGGCFRKRGHYDTFLPMQDVPKSCFLNRSGNAIGGASILQSMDPCKAVLASRAAVSD